AWGRPAAGGSSPASAPAGRLAAGAPAPAERTGDAFVIDASRTLQGLILHRRDRHDEAEPMLSTAIEGLLRRHPGVAATALAYQSAGALYTGEVERARHLAEQAVRVAEPLRDYL